MYRLASANGTSGASYYELEMAYSPSGNILSKMVAGQLTDIQQGSFPVHYINDYSYTGSAPYQVAGIVDQNAGTSFDSEWDLNGNMPLQSEMIQGITQQRRLTGNACAKLLQPAADLTMNHPYDFNFRQRVNSNGEATEKQTN